jgi:hypothetical protein
MTETALNHRPGDIASRHVLGADGSWHQLAPTGPAPEQPKKKGKVTMKRWSLLLVPALLASAIFAAAPAEAATTRYPPRVWLVHTSDAVKHRVGLGETFTPCASKPVDEIDLKVRVRNAHKGRPFKEIWLLDGVKQAAFIDTWGSNGDFIGIFELTSSGTFEDGVWKLKLVKNGAVLAKSSVTLQTEPGC